ncbi:hypothetical protein GCM10011390_50850 [Aureimonas endophytica]|uniref:Type II toxin-antitoxin system ParD family antitoxin n=1 Tax=Aureimonas endophytica TaxID=2027858 RepID=A0A917A405_9HYPH|nr:type II toxin-antitoxin system ParD family antitoxin [Aureimonas endophytica]GGE25202.1 hypothetical protein GCM10011390_50850 [Aureimonas endophytica]
MTTGRALTIVLPPEMIRMVEAKIASGQYADENAVIEDGLRILAQQDDELDLWLKAEIPERYAEILRSPAIAIPSDEVFAGLEELHRRRNERNS